MTRVFSSTEPAPRWRSPGIHTVASRAWVQLPEHGRRAVLATQQYYSLDNSDHASLIVAVALTDDPVANTAERCPWRRSRGGRDGVCAPLRRCPRPRRGQHQPLRYCMHSETVATRTKRLVAARPDARRATAARCSRATSVPLARRGGWRPHPCSADVAGAKRRVLEEPRLPPPRGPVERGGKLRDRVRQRNISLSPTCSWLNVWDTRHLTADPGSDAALVDLDEDDAEELVVISPFHGDIRLVYHQRSRSDGQCDNGFQLVYTHPNCLPFLHAICRKTPHGCPCVVLGHRAGNCDLLLFSYFPAKGYHVDWIAHDCGPANVMKLQYATVDGDTSSACECIVSCNRETDAIALYDVFPVGA